jgi:hypothetical protein
MLLASTPRIVVTSPPAGRADRQTWELVGCLEGRTPVENTAEQYRHIQLVRE